MPGKSRKNSEMNKLGKSLALSCIAGLLLISCSKGGPEETFELMRQEACEGDVEGFFHMLMRVS